MATRALVWRTMLAAGPPCLSPQHAARCSRPTTSTVHHPAPAPAGFAVFRSPLKEDSEPALRMLRESRHQLVMITGDAPLTACHTAAQVHIVTRPALILGRWAGQRGATSGRPLARLGLRPHRWRCVEAVHATVGILSDSCCFWLVLTHRDFVPACRSGGSGAALSWQSPDECTCEPFDSDPDAAWQLAQEYDLCITGGPGEGGYDMRQAASLA